MFDIMFMRPQKQNETVVVIWSASHRQFIRSAQSSKSSAEVASSLEQMRLLADESRHTSTKARQVYSYSTFHTQW